MPKEEIANLYKVKKNGTFSVVSVPEIGLLESMGLREGTQILVQNRYAFGGPVLLKVADAYCVALGKDIAKQITVRPIKEEKEEEKAA